MHDAPPGPLGPPRRLAFGLDGLAVAALVTSVLVTAGDGRKDVGFLGDPLPDGLAVLAFASAIAAGAVAARALARDPLRTRAGRWALRLAIAFAVSFPLLGLLTAALGLDEGWAEPLAPLQLAFALGAMLLGGFAREPGRRGILLIPLVIGASALMFVLVDLIVPY